MATLYAARYARALLDVLESNRANVEAADRELGDFDDAWRESVPLRNVFLDPSFPAKQKVDLLDKLNGRLGMSKPVRNFLAVIVNHDRMEAFGEILGEFRRMLRGDLGIDKVEWSSVRALNEGEQRAVEAKIHELTGKRVEATFRHDPGLLGGAQLRIGSTVYDGSVRGRLEQMKEALAATG
jgi:F-type H+-transporting ATPase subunit delta